jgi:TatD DNase family protein
MRVTLGCHPNCVKEMTEERWRELVNRICDNRYVVAIGETGLDYTRALKPEEQALQRFWTGRFVELSKGIKKPLVIHCRGEKAYDDLHELLLEHDICGQVEHPGVIHCFSGGEEDIKKFEALGFYFGIGGLFLKDEEVKQSICKMSLERVLLETDSPYLLPVGLTGKRNTSLNLRYVTDKLSEIGGTNTQCIIEKANKNAAAVFGEW